MPVKPKPLRFYLVVLLTVIALPLLAFATALAIQSAGQQRAALESGLVDTSRALAVAVGNELQGTISALNALGMSQYLDTGDLAAFYDQARRVQETQRWWYSVWLADADGNQVLSLARPPGEKLPSLADRDYFAGALQTQRPQVSGLLESRVTQGNFLAVAVPVMRDQKVKYVLVAGYRPEGIGAILRGSEEAPASGIAGVVDKDYRLIGRSRDAEASVGRRATDEYIAAVKDREQGLSRTVVHGGGAVYVAFNRVPVAQWTVGVAVAAAVVDGPLHRALGGVVALGILLLLAGIAGSIVLGRRIVAPIVSAARSAEALARGESPRLVATNVKEVAQLNAAIGDAARLLRDKEAARQSFERERQRAEHMFRLVVEASPVAKMMANRSGDIVLANPQAERLFGYTREELLETKVERLVPPEFREAHGRDRDRYWAAPGMRPMGAGRDLWAVRKDGSRVPVEIGLASIDAGEHGLFVLASVVDITERKRAEMQRAELLTRTETARAEAEAANHAKDEFLAMFGHELRNPLAALRAGIHVLRSGRLSGDYGKEAGDIIRRQVEHLARLVDDLLDIARLKRGKIRLERQPVELGRVVHLALESTRASAARKQHELQISASRDVWVEGDETRLQQIIVNLLDNAIKYTPPGGRICLDLKTEGRSALVSVSDNGPGIPASLLPHVFDTFRQGERTLDRGQGGLGLGLTIVRRLVELHHGAIEARSEAGKGACFVVRLPLTGAREEAPDTRRPASIAHKRILVVEDNRDVRTILQAALELDGHVVRVAEDGLQALELCSSWAPEVVLLDIGLPGLDGYEVARQLRRTADGARVLLVALTGYATPEDRQRAVDAGFDLHLPKPVDPEQLSKMLAGNQI
jgi:PAS domain S-box-containing protein